MSKEKIREKLRKIVAREQENCVGKDGSKLSSARADLKRKFLGHGYEVDADRREKGLSTYIDRTVLETVEWAKPGLMRVFCGEEIIRFDPRSADEEQAASDATMYVNQVVFGRNMFRLIHDVLMDGLYQRVGWCLAHSTKREERKTEQFEGLSEQEAQAVIMESGLDLEDEGSVEVVQRPSPVGTLFDVTLHRPVEVREIRLDPVPSEQVIVSADAKDVEHARFIAYWEMKSASDLLKEGYSRKLIDDLPKADGDDEMPETEVGRNLNDDGSESYEGKSPENQLYKVYEAWFDADINGDGIAEKVKVTYCGDAETCTVMKWEEWPLYRAPLFAASSIPMPHQVVGLCVADLVSDVQDLRTEMTRQFLDNIALSNQGELVVNEGLMGGEVEYDSLLARGVGSVHRIKGDASITPLPVSTSAGEAMQGITMTEQIVERRTGVSSRTQSIQADILQNTATGANIMEEAINQRLELIARVYAETFFKPLGRYLLHLLHKYHNKELQMRLKGKFLAFDPRKWNPDMEISVAVGLGSGNRAKLLSHYQTILSIQQAFLTQLGPASPIKLSNLIYTCHKMVEASGLEAPERFFGSEEDARRADQMMAQNKGDDAEANKLKLEQQKVFGKLQLEREKAKANAQIKAFEAQSKAIRDKQQNEAKIALKALEMQQEKELDEAALMRGDRSSGRTDIRGGMRW